MSAIPLVIAFLVIVFLVKNTNKYRQRKIGVVDSEFDRGSQAAALEHLLQGTPQKANEAQTKVSFNGHELYAKRLEMLREHEESRAVLHAKVLVDERLDARRAADLDDRSDAPTSDYLLGSIPYVDEFEYGTVAYYHLAALGFRDFDSSHVERLEREARQRIADAAETVTPRASRRRLKKSSRTEVETGLTLAEVSRVQASLFARLERHASFVNTERGWAPVPSRMRIENDYTARMWTAAWMRSYGFLDAVVCGGDQNWIMGSGVLADVGHASTAEHANIGHMGHLVQCAEMMDKMAVQILVQPNHDAVTEEVREWADTKTLALLSMERSSGIVSPLNRIAEGLSASKHDEGLPWPVVAAPRRGRRIAKV